MSPPPTFTWEPVVKRFQTLVVEIFTAQMQPTCTKHELKERSVTDVTKNITEMASESNNEQFQTQNLSEDGSFQRRRL